MADFKLQKLIQCPLLVSTHNSSHAFNTWKEEDWLTIFFLCIDNMFVIVYNNCHSSNNSVSKYKSVIEDLKIAVFSTVNFYL